MLPWTHQQYIVIKAISTLGKAKCPNLETKNVSMYWLSGLSHMSVSGDRRERNNSGMRIRKRRPNALPLFYCEFHTKQSKTAIVSLHWQIKWLSTWGMARCFYMRVCPCCPLAHFQKKPNFPFIPNRNLLPPSYEGSERNSIFKVFLLNL